MDKNKNDLNRDKAFPEYLKTIIRGFITTYEKIYADEFQLFLKGKKEKYTETDFGSFKKNGLLKNTDYLLGELVEYPSTLHFLLQKNLKEDEFQLFNSLGGKQWMRKEFPEFRPERIR